MDPGFRRDDGMGAAGVTPRSTIFIAVIRPFTAPAAAFLRSFAGRRQAHRSLRIRVAIVAKILGRRIAARLVVPGMEPAAHQRRMHLPAVALTLENGLAQGGGIPFALDLAGEPTLGDSRIA